MRFSLDEMLTYLGELDAELDGAASSRPKANLMVGGGFVMATRMSARMTGDIDIISDDLDAEMRSAAARVAQTHGIPGDWLNDGPKAFAVALEHAEVPVYGGRNFTLVSPGERYILAMKLAAARVQDEADAVLLVRELRISDLGELLDLIESALPGPRAPEARHEYFASQVLQQARKGRWRWRIARLGRKAFRITPDRTTKRAIDAHIRASEAGKLARCGSQATITGRPCAHLVAPRQRRCPAGHRPKR